MTDNDDVIGRLYQAVEDYQVEWLDGLMRKANLMWRCPSCGAQSRADTSTCDECGKDRTKSSSLFQPGFIVYGDGRIVIDWSNSYVNTADVDDNEIDLGDEHSTILDKALGIHEQRASEVPTPQQLRNLADYIEAREKGVPLGKPFEPLDLPDNIEAGRYDDLLVNIETACRNRRILMEADGIEVPWEGELPR